MVASTAIEEGGLAQYREIRKTVSQAAGHLVARPNKLLPIQLEAPCWSQEYGRSNLTLKDPFTGWQCIAKPMLVREITNPRQNTVAASLD